MVAFIQDVETHNHKSYRSTISLKFRYAKGYHTPRCAHTWNARSNGEPHKRQARQYMRDHCDKILFDNLLCYPRGISHFVHRDHMHWPDPKAEGSAISPNHCKLDGFSFSPSCHVACFDVWHVKLCNTRPFISISHESKGVCDAPVCEIYRFANFMLTN